MKLMQRIYNFFGNRFSRKKKLTTSNVEDITIISSNCIAGRVYHDFGLKFCSPTINLFFDAKSFLLFALDLQPYLEKSIIWEQKESDYPIGLIGDVTIHFLHYKNIDDALLKWERRKKRVNYSSVFVVMTDRDGFSMDMLEQFNKIPYKKVLFTSQKIDNKDAVYMPEFKNKSHVGIMTDFYRFSRKRYYELHFDFAKWLTGKFSTSDCIL